MMSEMEQKINTMQDKTVVITCYTDGIGKETARQLAQLGMMVIAHGLRCRAGMPCAVSRIAAIGTRRDHPPHTSVWL
jgi:NAD(P)-dependent dehydrogenase (short-subunit alcohol dehydrogenase family)